MDIKSAILLFATFATMADSQISAKGPRIAYDMGQAEEICADLPLESIEGIWNYPEDKVTVLILADKDNSIYQGNSTYSISVVKTEDTRLKPGEVIGTLTSTAESGVFKIELATERKNDFLVKPKSCLATLSSDGDSFKIKKQKTGLKGRFNLNFNRLLPGFWKIVSTGISTVAGTSVEAPVGMIKVYPSYDGNGSSKRKVRYL